MLCADTSFLFSLYRRDGHSAEAQARLEKAGQPQGVAQLEFVECGEQERLAEFRGLLPAGEAATRLEGLAEDQAAGRWRLSEIELAEIVTEAGRLSAKHTLAGGHRAFDILHVAHARLAGPNQFLSFDANQLRLAKAVGLRC